MPKARRKEEERKGEENKNVIFSQPDFSLRAALQKIQPPKHPLIPSTFNPSTFNFQPAT